MTDTDEGAYVAFKSCGCPAMATMETCRDAGREVAKAIKNRERVERLSVEAVRTLHWTGCDQCRPQRAASQEALL